MLDKAALLARAKTDPSAFRGDVAEILFDARWYDWACDAYIDEEIPALVRVLRRSLEGMTPEWAAWVWHMKEGTHRLRAAKALGIAPTLVHVPWWRTKAALERARYGTVLRAHEFERVVKA